MPRLILVRHAKAVDRYDADDDFERGLTPRGREDAANTARRLQSAGIGADLALVSPAQRTMQTYIAMRELMGNPGFEDPMALYHASPDMLLRALTDAMERAESIVLVGHNPGIGVLAQNLAERAGRLQDMPDGYPTAAATAFSVANADLDQIALDLIVDPKA